MLIFDENTMTKSELKRGFILGDDDFCVAYSPESVDFIDGAIETEAGDEVWILNIKTDANDTLFVYFPALDYATCILSVYVE